MDQHDEDTHRPKNSKQEKISFKTGACVEILAQQLLANYFTQRVKYCISHQIHCTIQPVWFCCDQLQDRSLITQIELLLFHLVAQIKIYQYLQKYKNLPLKMSSSKLSKNLRLIQTYRGWSSSQTVPYSRGPQSLGQELVLVCNLLGTRLHGRR